MTQTLKNLINTVAAEVYDLQDTKADRVELNAYVRTIMPESGYTDSSGNPASPLITLVKTGNVLSLNTENLKAVLSQITNDPDIPHIDFSNYINNVVTDTTDPFQYLNITSDGHDLHVDYTGLLALINGKISGSSLSSYLRSAINDAGDTAQTPLIQLTTPTVTDSSGNSIGKSLNISYAPLRDQLSQKVDLLTMLERFLYYVRYLNITSGVAENADRLIVFGSTKGFQSTDYYEGASLNINMTNLESAVNSKAPKDSPTFTGIVSGITKAMIQLDQVDNTSDANKPISTATQTALNALTNTVTTQGTTLGNKVDNSTLTANYYTNTQLDTTLAQKQGLLTVKGNESNDQTSGQGWKLLDSSGNLRSLRAISPYNVELNNNTQLIIRGPPSFTVYGDDNSYGMRVVNASNVIKSLKSGGYIQIGTPPNADGSQDYNSLLISTNDALVTALDSKANRSDIPSLAGYLNSVVNDINDLSSPKLIVLDISGNSLTINYATLRSVLSQKANASAIPDVSGFINTVSNYADSNNYITLSKTGQTLSVTYPSLVTALNNLNTSVGQKQGALTAIGDAADTTSIRVLNGVNVRALKAGTNATLSLASDIVTINGPDLSGYATSSSLTSGLGNKQNTLIAIGDAADTTSIRTLNGVNVRALKAGTNATLSLASDIVTINGPDLSSYATTSSLTTALSAKQNSLTAKGDAADSTSVRVLNGVNVRALKAGTNTTLSLDTVNDILTINGPSNYVDLSSTQSIGGNKTFTGTVTAPTIVLGSTSLATTLSGKADTSGANFTGAVSSTSAIQATGIGAFKAVPTADDGVSEIYWCRKVSKAAVANGDIWVMGHNTYSAGIGCFGIGAVGLNLVTKIDTTGTTTFNYPVSCSSSLNVLGGLTINGQAVPRANQVAAQFTLNGGGIVTWTGAYLKWTVRVLALPLETNELATSSYYDIVCPTSGTVVYYNTGAVSSVTCTSDGIPLDGWRALYYELPATATVSTSDPSRFRVVAIGDSTWSPDGNWMLLAVNNVENGIKWMPGPITIPKDSGLPATYNTATGACSWLSTQYQAKPWVAGKVNANGTIAMSLGRSGFTVTKSSAVPGLYTINMNTAHPSGTSYIVQVTGYSGLAYYLSIASGSFGVGTSQTTGGQTDLEFSFSTNP